MKIKKSVAWGIIIGVVIIAIAVIGIRWNKTMESFKNLPPQETREEIIEKAQLDNLIGINFSFVKIIAEESKKESGSYKELVNKAKDIIETISEAGGNLIIEVSEQGDKYCAYADLLSKQGWLCVDAGTDKVIATLINPAKTCKKGAYQCPLEYKP